MSGARATLIVLTMAATLSLGCSSGDMDDGGGTDETADSADTGASDPGVGDADGGDPDAGGPDDSGDAGPAADALDGGGADDGADAEDAGDIDPGAGFDYPCEPGTFQACLTACNSAGQQMCLKDWGPCIPPDEFCGNCADDDCDGLIDETCEVEDPCDPDPDPPDCPVAVITLVESTTVGTGAELHLSADQSSSEGGAITQWEWTVQAPAGAQATFSPSSAIESPTLTLDVAGDYLIVLRVWDELGTESCVAAQLAVHAEPYPPQDPEVGCADGQREGFLDQAAWPQIAGCAGAWTNPGITPDTVDQTCGAQGGDDGPNADGGGCSAPDLCDAGWHICSTWEEVAARSPTGCAGATPADAKPKSLFFAIRQPSETGSVCGAWGDGFNDVFGCGNLGAGLGGDKGCGPLDRVLASTQPNSCGFNEAEPNLGPWECNGTGDSHLREGELVTKKGCPGASCSYDGYPVGSSDKGGVLCCRD